MAARLFSKKGRVTIYLPNIGAAVKHFRAFSSSFDGHRYNNPILAEDSTSARKSHPSTAYNQTVWPDNSLGPFGPKDRRFPLPGLIGPSSHIIQKSLNLDSRPVDPDMVLPPLTTERQNVVLEQFLNTTDSIEEEFLINDVTPSPEDFLECVAQECPQILRKDFANLFPDRNIIDGVFTVITMSQKTDNDMTSWSVDVENEREELLESFIQGAQEICEALQEAGYWADFIDPSCGKPYLGHHTNSTLFETDERYRKLGFQIEDLGCCKVISHHLWGTHSYIGCLFTNAPLDHEIIKQMRPTQST